MLFSYVSLIRPSSWQVHSSYKNSVKLRSFQLINLGRFQMNAVLRLNV